MAGKGASPAACGQEQHVLFRQFLGYRFEALVLCHPHIIAASKETYPLDITVDNIVNQRL